MKNCVVFFLKCLFICVVSFFLSALSIHLKFTSWSSRIGIRMKDERSRDIIYKVLCRQLNKGKSKLKSKEKSNG